MSITETDALMELCRKHNVSSVECHGTQMIKISFFPAVPTIVKAEEKKPEKDSRPIGIDAALSAL